MTDEKPKIRQVNRAWRRDAGGPFHDSRKEQYAQLRVSNATIERAAAAVGISGGTARIWEVASAMVARQAELRGGATRMLPVSRGYVATRLKAILDYNTLPPEGEEAQKAWRPDFAAAIGAAKELVKMLEHEEKSDPAGATVPKPLTSLPSAKRDLRGSLRERLGKQPDPIEAKVVDG